MLADSPWDKALEKPPTFIGKEMDLHSNKSGDRRRQRQRKRQF